MFELLGLRRFLPLFLVQFLGAFNGNLFKNAAIALIIYQIGLHDAGGGKVLATIATGLFVLPFFLFSATAGELADRYDKARLIRLSKLFEVIAAVVAALAFWQSAPVPILFAVFLLGLQAALFGPLKYGILPDHLSIGQLLPANGIIEAGTFIAILAGNMAGNLSILSPYRVQWVAAGVIVSALAGWGLSFAIPPAPGNRRDSPVRWNIFAETAALLRWAGATPELFRPMLGVSWFWLAGATYLTQFAAFSHDSLSADSSVVALFLTTFTIGISLGSLVCPRLLKGKIDTRLSPWGALGMGLFGIDFALSATHPVGDGALLNAVAFLSSLQNWRLLIDLLMTAVCGGLYVVPLYTLLQSKAPPHWRARVIAANNVLNALFMVGAAAGAAALLAAGYAVQTLLAVMAAINLGVALFLFYGRRGPDVH